MGDAKQILVTGGPGSSGDAGAQAGRRQIPGPRARQPLHRRRALRDL